jgi:hypothetical protein
VVGWLFGSSFWLYNSVLRRPYCTWTKIKMITLSLCRTFLDRWLTPPSIFSFHSTHFFIPPALTENPGRHNPVSQVASPTLPFLEVDPENLAVCPFDHLPRRSKIVVLALSKSRWVHRRKTCVRNILNRPHRQHRPAR